MNLIKYPTENDVDVAIKSDEPLLMLISFDGKTAIMSHVDEAMEHHILLAKAGFPSTDIDKYFRIIFDQESADWTFVCPTNYKNISDKYRRIMQFYNDGFTTISQTLSSINYIVSINIPKRYRRHLNALGDNTII